MSSTSVHDEWLSLIEISGPFLAIPVLKEVFPQGLEELDGSKRKRLRQAYEAWREALETDDPQFLDLHAAWIDEVLSRVLELDEDRTGDVLKRGDRVPASLRVTSLEHGAMLAPDFAVVDSGQGDKPSMLIQTYAADVDLDATMKQDGWSASPAERMVQLCRLTGCRIGLVTNGERWMLVDAPVSGVTTFASWYARIWSQAPITLQAFVHLLGIRRFFFDQSEQLPALFDRSLKHQDEVTEALGEQVRRAVEVLIQSLDKADQDRDRELLRDVAPAELYEAGLTVMMRLVFLLSAEERGLLLLGDERYEANYALSTLRMKLRTESEEILERRWDAWSRLLAIFRAVFGGVEHENLRLPALGGSLFDPDRFPFLEGRAKGSKWRTDVAKPLPIDNRTVLLLLEAIQQLQGRTLSYRALDVEQIGYVYEGLLERTVKRTEEITLELDATKSAKTPWVKLAELESANLDGDDRLMELLLERSGSSTSRVRNDLAKPVEDALADRLLTACQGDLALRDRIKPYSHLLRTDPWGYPLVYPKGAFIVTTGSDRRETGTHYTPKSLTEAIVAETLMPVVYVGPAEGKPRDEWVLKSPAELLDLKICDPAMGSGAFLVQACRWLADRLVEAWSQAEGSGKMVSVDGEVLDTLDIKEPLPRDTEARTVIARRLIAERCLYGVDLNPLAVELAKLSIWLVTLAKGRPFGFLDHNLRCGDSLLGIYRLDQLTELSMTPTGIGQQRLFGQNIERAVHEAIELRQSLRDMPIRDIHDVEAMARLDADARRKLNVPELIADAFIGEVFASGSNTSAFKSAIASLTILAGQAISGSRVAVNAILDLVRSSFVVELPPGTPHRHPFHWPIEFLEVFSRGRSGFDCVVGNPPFLGGKKITGIVGIPYREHLVAHIGRSVRASADLSAYFFLRARELLRPNGAFGLLATNTIAEGDTREVGLDYLVTAGTLFSAYPNEHWPGSAAVVTSRVHFFNGEYQGTRRINGHSVDGISAFLSAEDDKRQFRLKANQARTFIGSYILSLGFTLSEEQAQRLMRADPKNKICLYPYINGQDVNSSPTQQPSRWVINFWDWGEDRARSYKALYEHVLQNVKPQRDALGDTVDAKKYKKYWWLYARSVPNLYHAIGRQQYFERPIKGLKCPSEPMPRVIVSCRVSKYASYSFSVNDKIFDIANNIYAYEQSAYFAFLQSSINAAWTWKNASRLKNDLRNSPSDTFETLPFPAALPSDPEFVNWADPSVQRLEHVGDQYHALRLELMIQFQLGLTKLYNRFHAPIDSNREIKKLRQLHCLLDEAVIRAYGWDDLDLGHGFHPQPYLPENDRVRFTISESARIETLRRLSELNHQRSEEEVAQELHGNAVVRNMSSTPRTRCTTSAASSQPELDFDTTSSATNTVRVVLGFLKAHDGWYAKADILAVTGISDVQWKPLINELIASGKVERQGEKRGARYRAVIEGAKE
jgi:hypothetical protein